MWFGPADGSRAPSHKFDLEAQSWLWTLICDWCGGNQPGRRCGSGEFGVFDDVGPVFEDPCTPGVLGGVGVGERLVEVGGLESAVMQRSDDAGLIWWCGGEDLVEFGEASGGLGGVERGDGLFVELWGVLPEPDAVVKRARLVS